MSNHKILFHPGKYILYTEVGYHRDYYYIENVKEYKIQKVREELDAIIEGPFAGGKDYEDFNVYYFKVKENVKCTENLLGIVVVKGYYTYGDIEHILDNFDITEHHLIRHILDCIDLESIESIDVDEL